MKISEIVTALDANVLTKTANIERDAHAACGSDMMSDVLAYVKEQGVLLTGLNNPQVVRTASMMDMICVIFVRGKMPDASMIKLADELDIVMISTKHAMFSSCGILYGHGLRNEQTAT